MDVDSTVSLSLSLSLSLSCQCRRRLCCSKRESKSPESYLDGRGDECFLKLVAHAGRRDDDRVLQSNENKKDAETEGGGCCGCRWNCAAAVSSPFFTMVIRDEWPLSFEYTVLFIPSLVRVRRPCRGLEKFFPPVLQRCYHHYSFYSFNAENSVHSIQ